MLTSKDLEKIFHYPASAYTNIAVVQVKYLAHGVDTDLSC